MKHDKVYDIILCMNNGFKKTIAIIRGGKEDSIRSMKNGANIIVSLSKALEEVNVLDVVIDDNLNWFEKGIPSEPHSIFSKSDFYIDFTNNKNVKYKTLAEDLGVKDLFSLKETFHLNRLTIKRILEQLNINTPKYKVIREKRNLLFELKSIWNVFHTPLAIKETEHNFNKKSLLTYSFIEAYKKIEEILDEGREVLIEEHIKGKAISVAVIPNYRNQDIYIPPIIENINIKLGEINPSRVKLYERCLIGHDCEKKVLVNLEKELKESLINTSKTIFETLFLKRYILVDFVLKEFKSKSGIVHIPIVVDIHINPNIFEDSKMDFILKNGGVDLGRFIIDRIEKLEEDKKIF